jgi:hypothetical protein
MKNKIKSDGSQGSGQGYNGNAYMGVERSKAIIYYPSWKQKNPRSWENRKEDEKKKHDIRAKDRGQSRI